VSLAAFYDPWIPGARALARGKDTQGNVIMPHLNPSDRLEDIAQLGGLKLAPATEMIRNELPMAASIFPRDYYRAPQGPNPRWFVSARERKSW
jgi:hypothetical protein